MIFDGPWNVTYWSVSVSFHVHFRKSIGISLCRWKGVIIFLCTTLTYQFDKSQSAQLKSPSGLWNVLILKFYTCSKNLFIEKLLYNLIFHYKTCTLNKCLVRFSFIVNVVSSQVVKPLLYIYIQLKKISIPFKNKIKNRSLK